MACFHSSFLCETALKENGLAMNYYGAEIQILATIVKQWSGYEKIALKLEKISKNFRQFLLNIMHDSKNEFKVLNHGDPWVNNTLFKYDENSQIPTDVVFIDFQMTHWASPGFDINYFLYTSCKLDDLQTRRDEYLKVYYMELEATLKSQNYGKIPTFGDLEKCVLAREVYGFFACFAILPLVALNKEAAKENSLDNLADENYAQRKIVEMYSTPRVVETLKYGLKRFDQLKCFD